MTRDGYADETDVLEVCKNTTQGLSIDLLAKQEELASIIEVTARWLTSLETNDLITQAKQKADAQISDIGKVHSV